MWAFENASSSKLMLLIEYNGLKARWDRRTGWTNVGDPGSPLAEVLNRNIPEERISSVFLEQGREGEVLQAAQRIFGPELKVLEMVVPKPPPDLPGVVY